MSDTEKIKGISRHKPKLDNDFIIQLQGKNFVLYSGLLDLAHQKGILRINVDVEQFPTDDNGNVAVCKAIVESTAGEEFIEWGDASPKNVNKKLSLHVLRMAATRAKARALRDFTNIGMTCMEELGGMDETEEIPSSKPETKPKNQPKSKLKKKQDEPATKPIPISTHQGEGKPSIAQLKAIENLAARRGIKPEMLEETAKEKFGISYKQISPSDAAAFIRYLQKSA